MNVELTGAPDERLDQWLRLMVNFRRDNNMGIRQHGYEYECAEDFVLQHGKVYDPATARFVDGAPKCCYGNSIAQAALNDWSYVEGYALAQFGMAFQHAWCVDESGVMVECTWPSSAAGLAYLGVEFAVGRADDATWNGDASVLDDFHRHWPLFRERWQGEDPSIEWADSQPMKLLRAAASSRSDR